VSQWNQSNQALLGGPRWWRRRRRGRKDRDELREVRKQQNPNKLVRPDGQIAAASAMAGRLLLLTNYILHTNHYITWQNY